MPSVAMSILASPERLISDKAFPYCWGDLEEERVGRKMTDEIFGTILDKNEGALLSDDPSFQGAISLEPMSQLEVVAQARQTSDAEELRPGASVLDTTPEPVAILPMTQRRVLTLATPIIGENLLQTLVGAVD